VLIKLNIMYVIFDRGIEKDLAMSCFYENREEQKNLMDRSDVDKQVKEWQKTNTGNPPKFYSRIRIKDFTNRDIRFSNFK
jgi:hypothetical protein